MAYAEQLVKSWRACWRNAAGRIEKESGFPTRRAALDHATAQEVDARRQGHARHDASQLLFREWAQEWYDSQDLEPSTMRRYKSTLQNHLLREWGEWSMRELSTADQPIQKWKKRLLTSYTQGSTEGIVGMLVTMLGDAEHERIISRNPAAARRGRGRQAPKRAARAGARYERITDPLETLLIAERAAYLSGRDDEFVLIMAKYWLGLRWGEAIGLTEEALSTRFHLDKQLYEHPRKTWYWKGPKSGSTRDIDVPPFLVDLLRHQSEHGERIPQDGQRCPCSDAMDAGDRKKYKHRSGIHLFTEVGGEPHPKANTFRYTLFYPAARGAYYADTKQHLPVFLADAGDPWSVVATGKGLRRPADPAGQWEPIRPGMKVHGLRHSHRALLEELGTPKVAMDDRLGHSDASVSARYSHVTEAMRAGLAERLQARWEECVEQRREMNLESPVPLVRSILERHSRSTPDGKPRRGVGGRGMVA